MKRHTLLAVCAFSIAYCSAQTTLYLKKEGESLEDFVPRNWRIIDVANGDLNADNIDDAALVIQEMDPKNILINDGMGIDTLDSNPRMLLILFKDTLSSTYRLKDISKTFILNHYSPTMDDPFDGIAISNNILRIGFHFWFSAGSWFQSSMEYKFRFQKGEFCLIGAEFDQIHRASMEGLKRSFNFLTKKMSETRSTFEDDQSGEQVEKVDTKWINLNFNELKTLKTLTAPLRWEVAPGVGI